MATTDNFYENKKNTKIGLCPECKKCTKAKLKLWRKRNPDKQKILNDKDSKRPSKIILKRLHSKKRKEEGKERDWRLKNPDKSKIYSETRQHKNHNIRKEEWEACKAYFDYRCCYCGLHINEHYFTRNGITKPGDFHKEHKDHDGKNDLSNCLPSCSDCNDKKWLFTFDEWYNENNPIYNQERYNKIIKWINEDYKLYIQPPKPKQKYVRKNSMKL